MLGKTKKHTLNKKSVIVDVKKMVYNGSRIEKTGGVWGRVMKYHSRYKNKRFNKKKGV